MERFYKQDKGVGVENVSFIKDSKICFTSLNQKLYDRFTLPVIIFKRKNCVNEFITWVLKKYKWTKQITKQYFNKRLITTK